MYITQVIKVIIHYSISAAFVLYFMNFRPEMRHILALFPHDFSDHILVLNISPSPYF
jgi:hypothetical protein